MRPKPNIKTRGEEEGHNYMSALQALTTTMETKKKNMWQKKIEKNNNIKKNERKQMKVYVIKCQSVVAQSIGARGEKQQQPYKMGSWRGVVQA